MSESHHTNTQQPDGDIDAFLSGSPFAVVGASTNRDKYGNKVLRCYQQAGRSVVPVNPRATEIEGLAAGRFPPELRDPLLIQGLLSDDEEYWPFEGDDWPDEYVEPANEAGGS